MMKLAALVLLAFLGAANADVTSDVMEILERIPIEKIRTTFEEYVATDPEVQALVAYMASESYQNRNTQIANSPQAQNLRQYIEAAGLNIDAVHQYFASFISIARSTETVSPSIQQRSAKDMYEKMLEDVPLTEMMFLVQLKRATIPTFRAFWGSMSSSNCHSLFDALLAIPEVQEYLQEMRDMQIPVDTWIAMMKQGMGWK